ncbi:TatD family hydrolase [Curvibacter sp. CHRR-16]|uniref:TatD family hydrolase n=1 Tax=Curvibacter sp. CHRR-16 TaxID=2835872 RepID=UPI001BDAAADC|nr:TatD family hydrolase [Curvibacter sp. CHRR-16]MBT0571671.1 TatD family hydrolase [Curvibacter sp. CHRR-16]
MSSTSPWIDTHVHLDAPEFASDVQAVQQRARDAGVRLCVIPAVLAEHTNAVLHLAHTGDHAYALGLHPLFVPQALQALGDTTTPEQGMPAVVQQMAALLDAHAADARLVAVGEIGLDYFEPLLQQSPWRDCQEQLYRAQLELAWQRGLPVIVHSRRSVDAVLKHLRAVARMGKPSLNTAGTARRWRGIAHAFSGSVQQAQAFVELGFKLGFGGALTYERALNLRRLATDLPLDALVLETDAPDIPPHWLYATAEQRAAGQAQGRNEPAELPRIAQVLAQLRNMPLDELAHATTQNALEALPRLRALL